MITDVNGKRMKEHSAIVNAIGLMKPGSTVELKYYRDGKSKVANVVIDQHPDDTQQLASDKNSRDRGGDNDVGGLGIAVATLNAGLRSQFRLESKSGVAITEVRTDSPADRAGLRRGDCILKVDGKKTTTAVDLKKFVKGKNRVLIWIERAGEFYFVTLRNG